MEMSPNLKALEPSTDSTTIPATPTTDPAPAKRNGNGGAVEIRVAHGFDEMLMAFSIRSAVFLAEQSCPYAEEFDGNDAAATHVLGFIDGEPAATMRIRYFGQFVKMERMAVRREYRGTTIAFKLLDYSIELVRRKGFKEIMAHTQIGRERFWQIAFRRQGGYRHIAGVEQFSFSGHFFQPIQVSLESEEDSFALDTDPNVLNRPEGDWDRPGILELGIGQLPAPSRKIRA